MQTIVGRGEIIGAFSKELLGQCLPGEGEEIRAAILCIAAELG